MMPRFSSKLQLIALVVIVVPWTPTLSADDWPMWRHDAARSAASAEQLPDQLQLVWKLQLPSRVQAWDDPLNLDLMTYDRIFEPIVMGGRMFVGFNDQDKLVAYDAGTGRPLWTFYAEAPVRLPPVGSDGRVYFCSDDGFLYCVDAVSGTLVWKFSGAPSSQHAIGNRRLTSAWPARGGPVVRDGTVYFAASIWPFMGTFIYALDADSGTVLWINDRTGSQYIKQPHSAPSFAGVAPQGSLVATESLLLVPGGRSVPAVFDRATGKQRYFELNAGGKGTGGSFVAANETHFYVHTRDKGTRAFNLSDGIKTAFQPNEPVLAGGRVYASVTEDDGHYVSAFDSNDKELWRVAADARGDLILAGNRLYAAGTAAISVIELPTEAAPAHVVGEIAVDAQAERLLAADDMLFAVTLDGSIIAMGENAIDDRLSRPTKERPEQPKWDDSRDADSEVAARATAADLLAATDAQGYAFWFGNADHPVLHELARDCPFEQLAIVDPDFARVERFRRQLDAAGLHGRMTVHPADPRSFRAPHYVAHAVFVSAENIARLDDSMISAIYQSVRPFGGVMHLLTDSDRPALAAQIDAMGLEQAEVAMSAHGIEVRRVGALPGSADWTHQSGDIANTLKSDDSRVKLPLGVLWFGGSSHLDVLPRHGHGPPEQVIGGRLFIQGINSLSARDVYTGRVLWKRDFEDLGTYDVYYDDTFEDVPLNPKYNQVHIPGANGRGTNYVAASDRVYLVEGSVCHALDPATGETLHDFHLPPGEDGGNESWAYIGVYEDVLIGGLGFARYGDRHELKFESDKKLSRTKAGFGSKSLDRAGSMALVGFDRHTGKQLWTAKANHSFWHNGIVAGGGQVFCLDKNPAPIEEALKRRGKPIPDTYRIMALNYRSGEVNWEVTEDVFGTWLGYSQEHDLLLQAGAKASDRLYAEVETGMSVHFAKDGSVKWKDETRKYAGPCVLHNDLIITNTNSYAESAGAFYLSDGKPKMVRNPVTGQMQPWKMTRAYGCNSIIASENLLTFRSGAAGFYDLLTNAGTGNLGGFKSGCTSNLVVAGGVLNAPDYTRTCSCAYQNQTSLALVHMPEIDVWTVSPDVEKSIAGQTIERLGVNFGAPGDRRDPSGLLWLEYPVVAGESAPVTIELNPEATFFQHHSSAMAAAELPWVMASGAADVSDVRIALKLADEKESTSESADEPTEVTPPATGREPTTEKYDLRLHFGAPPHLQSGIRVFDVYVQGERVLENVTLDPAGDEQARRVVETIEGISISDTLHVHLEAIQGSPLISGIQMVRRGK